MSKPNPVVHFEMGYKNAKRISDFYSKAFGWKMDNTGPEMGNYLLAGTTETKDGRAVTPGAINGGFFEIKPDSAAQITSVVIAVDDIKKSIKEIEKAGGKVHGEPMEIPGIGQYVSFNDTEGNRVGMLQPSRM